MMPLKYTLPKEQGFTLVELLVVIAIIAILTAIAVPAFLSQRKKSIDATLIADTKNAAAQVLMYLTDDSKDVYSELRGLIPSNTSGALAFGSFGEGRSVTDASLGTSWDSHSELPTITVSKGNKITININTRAVGTYLAHERGEFCLSSDNPDSSYTYSHGSVTGPANYDKLVYYDVSLGGIVTMDEMIQALRDGQQPSCNQFVNRYMVANGLS